MSGHCQRTSLAIGLATAVAVVRIGGVLYRRGIVHTGRRLRFKDALLRTP